MCFFFFFQAEDGIRDYKVTGVQTCALPISVHDAHEVEERVALPLAGGEARLLLERTRVPLGVPRAHGVRPIGLGEAVDVDGAEAELLELAEERRRRRGARDAHRDRVPEPVRLRVVDDADVDGRRAVVVGDALRVDQLPDPGGLDTAQADVGAGDGGDAPGETPAVAVEHRERPEVLRVDAHVGLEHLTDRVDPRPTVGVHNALGPARRARGVVDRGGLVYNPRTTGPPQGDNYSPRGAWCSEKQTSE